MTSRKSVPLPPNAKDLISQMFGRWTVIAYLGRSQWLCCCECGTEKSIFTGNLSGGKTKSCGCFRDDQASKKSRTHGLTKTAEYKVWAGIKRRCLNKSEKSYNDYGARGITICKRWSDSFEAFLEDVGPRPSPQHTIERIDNEKGYEPNNCRWATRDEQAVNKRNNRRITFLGVTRVLAEWARLTGIHRATIEYRLDHGWSVEHTLTTPARIGRNQFSSG